MTIRDPDFQTMLQRLQVLSPDIAPEAPDELNGDADMFHDFRKAAQSVMMETRVIVSRPILSRHLHFLRAHADHVTDRSHKAELERAYLALVNMHPPMMTMREALDTLDRMVRPSLAAPGEDRVRHLTDIMGNACASVWHDHEIDQFQERLAAQLYDRNANINICPDARAAATAAEDMMANIHAAKGSLNSESEAYEHPKLIFAKKLMERLNDVCFPVDDVLYRQHCADVEAEVREDGDISLRQQLQPKPIGGKQSLNFNQATSALDSLLTTERERREGHQSERYHNLEYACLSLADAIWTGIDTTHTAKKMQALLFDATETRNVTIGPVWAERVTREFITAAQGIRRATLGMTRERGE